MLRLISLAAVSALAIGTSADAEDDGALARAIAACAVEVVHADRLACYDRAASAAGLVGSAPMTVPAPEGKWLVQRQQNPLDNTETVTVALLAEDGRAQSGVPITFVARCLSNRTDAYIAWGDFLGDDSFGLTEAEWKRVTLRIGNGLALEEHWNLSTDTRATFAPAWAGTLLKQMATATSFLAQTTPAGASPVTAVFDTTGMRSALEPLASACGWTIE